MNLSTSKAKKKVKEANELVDVENKVKENERMNQSTNNLVDVNLTRVESRS